MDLSCIRHFCDGDRILLTSVWCQYKRYERVHEKVVGKSERRGRFIVPSADYDFSQPRSARGSVGAIKNVILSAAKDLTRRAPRSKARAQDDNLLPILVVKIHYRPPAGDDQLSSLHQTWGAAHYGPINRRWAR